MTKGLRPVVGGDQGYPPKLRLDNGPKFVALALVEWTERKDITLDFIKPGRPMQNGFIERFNESIRRGVLDMHVFLGGLTPAAVRQQHDPTTSDYGWH